jgi:GNAT superfamily N-acetyltransferase
VGATLARRGGLGGEADRYIGCGARLAVAPDRQHEGLGTRLLQAAIEHGGTWLFTGDRSEGNLRLYREQGFEETHREPVPGHELVYLRRPAA